MLRPLLAVGGLAWVAAVQHIGGLLIAIGVYALVLRLGGRPWVAALAAVPVLLDAYQLQIEQNIMSEVVFEAVLLGLLWVLLGRGAPGWKRAGVAGLLVGFAVLVRLIGISLALPLLVYLVAAGGAWRHWAGWRRAGVGLLGILVVVVPYSARVHAETGKWGLTGPSGNMLYGRTAAVADCANLHLAPELQVFCPAEPRETRLVDNYTHADLDPNWPGPLPPGADKAALAHQFAIEVLKAQPGDVAGAVLDDFAKSFAWAREQDPTDVPLDRWQFQLTYPQWADQSLIDLVTRQNDGVVASVDEPLAAFLRDYQLNGGYVPGAVLGIGALLGLLTVVRRKRPVDAARAGALLASTSGLVLLFASAVFQFSWRYQIPALVLLPVAGALGFTTLTSASRKRLAAFPDDVDTGALDDFRGRHPDLRLSSLVVVIAAYNEAAWASAGCWRRCRTSA